MRKIKLPDETTLINCVPHEINVLDYSGKTLLSIRRAFSYSRCHEYRRITETLKVGPDKEIPIKTVKYGEVENLPEPDEGTLYIVSSLVLKARKDRTDLITPYEFVRDNHGRIIGCRSFRK